MNIPEHKITSRPYPKDPSLTQVFYRFKEPLFVYGKSKGLSYRSSRITRVDGCEPDLPVGPWRTSIRRRNGTSRRSSSWSCPSYVPKPPRIYTTTFTVTTPDRLEPDDDSIRIRD